MEQPKQIFFLNGGFYYLENGLWCRVFFTIPPAVNVGGGGRSKPRPIQVQDEGNTITIDVRTFNFEGDGVTVSPSGDTVTVNIPGGGGDTCPASYANFYKQTTQLHAGNSDVMFEATGEKTADILHPSGTDIVFTEAGIYAVTVKLNDNSGDQHIFQLTLDGIALPQSVNGKGIITGISPDKSIQIETIIDTLISVTAGQVLRVNAPIGMGLDTAPLPPTIPPALKASITLERIDCPVPPLSLTVFD